MTSILSKLAPQPYRDPPPMPQYREPIVQPIYRESIPMGYPVDPYAPQHYRESLPLQYHRESIHSQPYRDSLPPHPMYSMQQLSPYPERRRSAVAQPAMGYSPMVPIPVRAESIDAYYGVPAGSQQNMGAAQPFAYPSAMRKHRPSLISNGLMTEQAIHQVNSQLVHRAGSQVLEAVTSRHVEYAPSQPMMPADDLDRNPYSGSAVLLAPNRSSIGMELPPSLQYSQVNQ